MGLERVAAVLQGVHDNYDTDTFKALIAACGRADPDQGARASSKASHRVIADHLRASGFLVADGVLPANEGRGYVLRRIMRRAMRHAHLLGAKEPLMHRLVPALVAEMGAAYPELVRAQPLIEETLKLEETRFRQTLANGLRLLDEATADLAEGATLPGETAFKLYDTYGFPYDLTEDALRAQGMGVDRAGFDAAMAEQKARRARRVEGLGRQGVGRGLVRHRRGIRQHRIHRLYGEKARARSWRSSGTASASTAPRPATTVDIVTNQTPFYGESGGQVGDAGTLTSVKRLRRAIVEDTAKPLGRLHAHRTQDRSGRRSRSARRSTRRSMPSAATRIRANHSATHLLHAALRQRLGTHVTQKGSLVAPDRLRFDFSHPKALTPEDIAAVEAEVNAQIRAE